ncbi:MULTISPECIES: MauE/DoxX family redox-associated membrane protein [unclassified Halomonas]|uniref:MauE/DoxX family redox-associated membrane protein n=1 Tax=unclassified Halomonas TaxID=2609666 RepID=UPI002885E799|nr:MULTISPECIES: MauE/DoxX family redox-associated membrane protein [unclassified Halomonas]MDT0500006.1 MauE/DoxX family redox-associated membrane protein [Halomonas sp. PAR7]MDT0512410.1 MauE/DoxX family redox-associated membrane protein [Halomonas sp. LES1]MDT0591044.1 MauE/DoxX family redox-associated membrane protein [Halomonas sp. PAR8]
MTLYPVFTLALSAILAVILLSAAMHKLRAPQRFRRQLDDYALLPPGSLRIVARTVPALEIALAILLLTPALRVVGALGTALLLGGYAGAMAINLWRGRSDIDCGCSGPGMERPLSPALLWRNALLVLMALLAALPTHTHPLGGFDLFLILACSLMGLMIYTSVEGLLANRPRLNALQGK